MVVLVPVLLVSAAPELVVVASMSAGAEAVVSGAVVGVSVAVLGGSDVVEVSWAVVSDPTETLGS